MNNFIVLRSALFSIFFISFECFPDAVVGCFNKNKEIIFSYYKGGVAESYIKSNKNEYCKRSSDENNFSDGKRFDVKSGDKIYILALDNITVTFDEVPRKLVLGKDAGVLIKIIAKVAGLGVAGTESLNYELHEYTLVETRAELNFTFSDESSGTKEDVGKYTIITGAREGWFLSADILVDKADQLVYDAESNSLVNKDDPTDFFLGINYMPWGDVINQKLSVRQRFFVKAMLKIDSDPLESYGFGLGYRPAFLESTSVYVAYVVSKEDAILNGQPSLKANDSGEVRVGISLNLDSALGWIK